MSNAFVPLELFLRPVECEAASNGSPEPPPAVEIVRLPEEYEETLRAARRFRAALDDALESAVQQLLRAVASEVLARELRLAGPDLAAIVSTALDRIGNQALPFVRAHPADCAYLEGLGLALVADDSMKAGDICIELQSGTIDLGLDARLDAALAAWAA
jgi:flagellar biosynthesis/type III secretory pathway protein FliH